MAVGNFKRKMRTVKTRENVRRREVDGYGRMRVEMERISWMWRIWMRLKN